MLFAYPNKDGKRELNPQYLNLTEPIKLNNDRGLKIDMSYGDGYWYLDLPAFNSKIMLKNEKYFVQTNYQYIINLVNQLVAPITNLLDKDRDKFGLTLSKDELLSQLTIKYFTSRTKHVDAFMTEKGPFDFNTQTKGMSIKLRVKPIVFVKAQSVYLDFNIMKANIREAVIKAKTPTLPN